MGVGCKLVTGPRTICKAEFSLPVFEMWWQWTENVWGLDTALLILPLLDSITLRSWCSQWSSTDVSHGDGISHGPFSLSGLRCNAAPSLRNLKGELDRGHRADDLDRAILGNDGAFLLCTYAQCLKRAKGQCNTRGECD